jgi:hypothetical protein
VAVLCLLAAQVLAMKITWHLDVYYDQVSAFLFFWPYFLIGRIMRLVTQEPVFRWTLQPS